MAMIIQLLYREASSGPNVKLMVENGLWQDLNSAENSNGFVGYRAIFLYLGTNLIITRFKPPHKITAKTCL